MVMLESGLIRQLLSVIPTTIIVTLVASCGSTADKPLSGDFVVIFVDTTFFCDYSLYRLKSQEGEVFSLLSEWHSNRSLTVKYGGYELIQRGGTYDLDLVEFDDLPIVEQCLIRSHIDEYDVFNEYPNEWPGQWPINDSGIVFWRNDTICAKAYWSPQVYDKYYVGD